MAANEEELLRRFQSSASPQTVRELLVVHQDRVYNACFQVLGRAEDAEDAAQEALLKLAEGARSARDADSFRGWIYRISFRVALDHWRRREAVKNRESRAAMNRPAAPPLDDRERLALFEAMDGLDDRERALLLEHYFEKVPLAALGERRGVSAVAIWKRIDRAREKLKKTLLGAGLFIATSRVSEALEASVQVTAPATLVGEAILGKILAGGLAVGATKSSIIPAIVVGLLLLFAVSTGGYVALRSREPAAPAATPLTATPNSHPVPAPAASESTTSAESVEIKVPDSKQALLQTLARYQSWHAEYKRLLTTPVPADDPMHHIRLRHEGFKQFTEARDQIFEDPKTFLDFIRDPANEHLVADGMLGDLLNKNKQVLDGWFIDRQYYKEFPPALLEEFLAMLRSGSVAVKGGMLGFFRNVHDVPARFDELYLDLMDDPDPSIQRQAVFAVWRGRKLDPSVLERIRQKADRSTDGEVHRYAILAVRESPGPETNLWMLDRFESNKDGSMNLVLAYAATKMASTSPEDLALADRVVKRLVQVIGDSNEAEVKDLLRSALQLPPAQSLRVFEGAQSKIVRPLKLKIAVEKVLEEARAGKTTANDLQNLFHQATRD